jgi:hypothetical protein
MFEASINLGEYQPQMLYLTLLITLRGYTLYREQLSCMRASLLLPIVDAVTRE